MQLISTTKARNNLSKFVNSLTTGESSAFVFGRRDEPEVVMISYPKYYSRDVSDITNVNSYSKSFDFLNDEPELYSVKDILKK
jgi:mRNA interferase MazF